MDIDIKLMQTLLGKLSQKCARPSGSESDEYNIFEVLGVEYKEVIMCRFIGNLLDPKGKHGLGTEPLRLFIRDVLGDKDFGDNLEEAVITLEDSTDNGRRVDIAIYLKDRIYPIEVKIWAGDQNEQLKDYYEYYFPDRKDAKIYYLTPDGHSPSGESTGEGEDGLKDEQIGCISFTEDIKNWLDKVLNIESASESIKSVIRNFMEVIDKMGQYSDEQKSIMETLELNKGAYCSEDIKSAILLLKHRDEIWNDIRKNYIRKILNCGENYKLIDCYEKDKNVSHTLFYVWKNDEQVAWICVDTNLYIVTEKKTETCDTGWETYNDKLQWKYIKNGNSKIPLRNPTVLEDVKEKQELKELLEGRS